MTYTEEERLDFLAGQLHALKAATFALVQYHPAPDLFDDRRVLGRQSLT
jgi:hypothetical protein